MEPRIGEDPVLFKIDTAGPRLCDLKSYQELNKAMGWGVVPGADQYMEVPVGKANPPFPGGPVARERERKASLKRKPPRSPSPRPARRQPPPKRQGRKRPREDRSGLDSDAYPSSSSSSDALPSSSEVRAMLPEIAKAPSRFKGKQKTACPTYSSSVWPRDKPCCAHACGGTSDAVPSSTLYNPSHVLSVRTFWYEQSSTDRRQFMANRMEDVNTGGDLPTRRFYMDHPDDIQSGNLTLAANKRVSVLYLLASRLCCVCVLSVLFVFLC